MEKKGKGKKVKKGGEERGWTKNERKGEGKRSPSQLKFLATPLTVYAHKYTVL